MAEFDYGVENVGVPAPIVTLTRAVLVGMVLLALVSQQPWITTLLLGILVFALALGSRGNLISLIGERLFARSIETSPRAAEGLMRFNNLLAASLLGGAQLAFLTGATLTAWVLSAMVAAASGLALAGFCLGCFLHRRLGMDRISWFGA